MTNKQAHLPSPAINAARLSTNAQAARGDGGRPIASALAIAFQIASRISA